MRNLIFRFVIVFVCATANVRGAEATGQRDRVLEFEKSLFAGGDGNDRFKQRPVDEQRPMVEVFFATLKTPAEKLEFLGIGDSRYVYAIDREVYGEFAVKLLEDADAAVRQEAIQGLVYNNLRKYAPQAERLLDDPNGPVRERAVVALGRFRRHDLVARIAEVARSANHETERLAGLTAMGLLLRDKQAAARDHQTELSMVTAHLAASAAPAMQTVALQMLAGVAEAADSIEAIKRLMCSADAHVREAAVGTMGHIAGEVTKDALRGALADRISNVRRAAAQALGSLKAVDSAGEVARLLQDAEAWVRLAAVEALKNMNATGQVDAIALRMKDEDTSVRQSVLETLGAFRAGKYARDVAGMLLDKDDGVRFAALRALAVLGTNEQAAAVAVLAQDSNHSIRMFVVSVLGALDAREERAVVEKLAGDENADVVFVAKEVLAKWDRK